MCFFFSVFVKEKLTVSCFYSVTGASRGYAFVEFETEKEMRRAYKVLNFFSFYIPVPV